ncbi:unnamed protein product [Rhizophagus irregularis]|nr:unnamed protein product [Rhizophagus irregularis]
MSMSRCIHSKSNIIEMATSFNCSVLGDKTLNCLHKFSINIYKNNDEIFTKLRNNRYDIKEFKVDHPKDYICDATRSDKEAVKLWKVNVNVVDVVDEVGIKEKLKDENKMRPILPFSYYFRDELSGETEFTANNIHVIQDVPQASPIVGPGSLKEVLSVILPAKIETSSERTEIPECQDLNYYNNNRMPLKERDTNNALEIFKNNVTYSFDRLTSKTNFNFLVCSGAAGIGKTRWGYEFFNCVKKDWSPPPSWGKPEYLYLLLDFVSGVRLSSFDKDVDAATILGLRVAFDYFARGTRRERQILFEEFFILVKPYIQFFRIGSVLNYIQNQEFQRNRLIIVLHIDEYQEIFAFEKWEGKKGLFKEMLYALGPLMAESENKNFYAQTFLSDSRLSIN